MTETEWLAGDDLAALMVYLAEEIRGEISARKARLFGCSMRHRIWSLLADERSRTSLEVSERYADGLATMEELTSARRAAWDAAEAVHTLFGASDERYQAAANLLWAMAPDVVRNIRAGFRSGNAESVREFLHDIFGNPFRPVGFSPEWRTDTVLALARQMYDSRDFGAMPVLADALQDANCSDTAVLMHCRGLGPHCKGCWVVDAVLGKE